MSEVNEAQLAELNETLKVQGLQPIPAKGEKPTAEPEETLEASETSEGSEKVKPESTHEDEAFDPEKEFGLSVIDDEGGNKETEKEEEEEEKPTEKEGKRYRDLQSFSHKVMNENEQLKRRLEALEKKGDGKAPDKDFPNSEDAPQKPTKEDWDLDPEKAQDKLEKYQDWKWEQKKKAEQNEKDRKDKEDFKKQENEKFKQGYIEKRNAKYNLALKLYPEAKDKNSRIFKLADKILRDDPDREYDPNCDYNAVIEAGMRLGMQPQRKKGSSEASSIMTPGGSNGGGRKAAGEISAEEFSKLPREKREQIMKAKYLGG